MKDEQARFVPVEFAVPKLVFPNGLDRDAMNWIEHDSFPGTRPCNLEVITTALTLAINRVRRQVSPVSVRKNIARHPNNRRPAAGAQSLAPSAPRRFMAFTQFLPAPRR